MNTCIYVTIFLLFLYGASTPSLEFALTCLTVGSCLSTTYILVAALIPSSTIMHNPSRQNYIEQISTVPKSKLYDGNEFEDILYTDSNRETCTDTKILSSIFYVVPSEYHMKRLDTIVVAAIANSSSTSLSRSSCSTLITNGYVTINGVVDKRKSFKVSEGMDIQIQMCISLDNDMTHNNGFIVAQDLPLSILYEDEHMIVINKAAGMVVHPAVGNRDGTVVNALMHYLTTKSQYGAGEFAGHQYSIDTKEKFNIFPTLAMQSDDEDENETNSDVVEADSSLEDDEASLTNRESINSITLRPGIVHRLDKGTTGVLVVAKTRVALANLSAQFNSEISTMDTGNHQRAEKTYLAITVGNPGQHIVIDRPIGRHPVYRQRMRVVPDSSIRENYEFRRSTKRGGNTMSGNTLSQKGRRALSFVDTIAFDGKLALVKVRIETGRTHQIRVHLQDRHTPIYGDDVYGLPDWNKRLHKTAGINRPMLHAFQLKIRHPSSGEGMIFQAPMPDDMRKIIQSIYPQGEEYFPDLSNF